MNRKHYMPLIRSMTVPTHGPCVICAEVADWYCRDLILSGPICPGCIVDTCSAEKLLLQHGFAHPGTQLILRNP